MAQRRMFSKQITDTDAFLDMPATAQNLYFHLNMHADDDGFLGNPKTVRRMIGAGEDDMKVLIAKQFILVFPDGVAVIRDWHVHNYIQKDRYHPTIYKEDKAKLEVSKTKQYQIATKKKRVETDCIQDVSKVDTQSRLGQSSLGQVRSSSSSGDDPVDKNDDDDDDRKNKLLNEIKKTAKKYASSDPTVSEWSAVLRYSKKMSWHDLRLVTLMFNAKISNHEVERPYPYLITVLQEKVKEIRI